MPYNPQELELLSLLKQEQQRNNTSVPTTQASGPLPDLDPAMFLSGSAQRELRAAQGIAYNPATTVPEARVDFEMATSWDVQADMDTTGTTLAGDASLDSLFMDQAIRETGGLVSPSGAPREAYSVDFDTSDLPMEGRAVPNERVRFQVGRQDPPYEAFRSQRSSSDGEIVGSFTGGRFQPVNPRPTRPAPVRPVRAVSRPVAAEPEAPAMSRLDRLLAPSPLD